MDSNRPHVSMHIQVINQLLDALLHKRLGGNLANCVPTPACSSGCTRSHRSSGNSVGRSVTSDSCFTEWASTSGGASSFWCASLINRITSCMGHTSTLMSQGATFNHLLVKLKTVTVGCPAHTSPPSEGSHPTVHFSFIPSSHPPGSPSSDLRTRTVKSSSSDTRTPSLYRTFTVRLDSVLLAGYATGDHIPLSGV
jgi:hypothetical protein